MRIRLLEYLRCPDCGKAFSLSPPPREQGAHDVGAGLLSCPDGHVFPIVRGIPRIYPGAWNEHGGMVGMARPPRRDGRDNAPEPVQTKRVRMSFSREWANHKLGDRTWYKDLRTRVQRSFLDPIRIPPEELAESVVLDAGCGNGSLSVAMTSYAAEVIAIDLSSGVELGEAFRERWPGSRPQRVHFVQGDLQRPPLEPGSVDIIHSQGVLHHMPDTHAAFRLLVPLLKPGGTLFVWLYKYEPLVTPILESIRAVTTRLPVGASDVATKFMAVPFMVFTRLVNATGLRSYPAITKREAALALMDIFGAPYAHYHSPAEVMGWFAAEGFGEVWQTHDSRRGFGVCGRLTEKDGRGRRS